MKICTWNSQGNPLNDAIKLNNVSSTKYKCLKIW